LHCDKKESAVLIIQCGEIDPKWSYFEENISLHLPYLDKKVQQVTKLREESSFFLFFSPLLSCSQIIWLNLLVNDSYTTYLTKLKKENPALEVLLYMCVSYYI